MDYNQAKKGLYDICKRDGSEYEKEVKKILDYHNNTNLINEGLDSDGWTVLRLASEHNHINIIRLLLSYENIDINRQDNYGYAALHRASVWGYQQIVELLLSKDKIDINKQDKGGYTALHIASSLGYREIVELLLSKDKIDINIKTNDSETALHKASRWGYKDIVNVLLSKNKVDINVQNNYGNTAIHEASYWDRKDIVELLLSNDYIDINIKNNDSETALDMAPDDDATEIKELIYCFKNSIVNIQSMKNSARVKYCNRIGVDKEPNKALVFELLMALLLFFVGYLLYTLLKNRSRKVKEALTIATTSATDEGRYDEGIMRERELLPVVDEKESLKLQIEVIEEKMREITNNNMKEMERRLVEKECVMLRDQIVRMEERFEAWMKQMERRFEEKERVLQATLGMVPLPLPTNKLTHVFLTHSWREDEKGRDNHDRVARVNEALRKRGLVTWFDSERLEDKIHETISKALYSTCCVLIFVTREYEKKVNSADDSDYCFYEFNVTATDPELANMRIPIVMDGSMLNPDSWEEGLLKAGLGGKVFIDLSSDDKDVFEERCNEVFVRVVKLLNI